MATDAGMPAIGTRVRVGPTLPELFGKVVGYGWRVSPGPQAWALIELDEREAFWSPASRTYVSVLVCDPSALTWEEEQR